MLSRLLRIFRSIAQEIRNLPIKNSVQKSNSVMAQLTLAKSVHIVYSLSVALGRVALYLVFGFWLITIHYRVSFFQVISAAYVLSWRICSKFPQYALKGLKCYVGFQ